MKKTLAALAIATCIPTAAALADDAAEWSSMIGEAVAISAYCKINLSAPYNDAVMTVWVAGTDEMKTGFAEGKNRFVKRITEHPAFFGSESGKEMFCADALTWTDILTGDRIFVPQLGS